MRLHKPVCSSVQSFSSLLPPLLCEVGCPSAGSQGLARKTCLDCYHPIAGRSLSLSHPDCQPTRKLRLFPILCSAWSLWGKTIWSMLALFVSMNWRTGILRGGRGHLSTSCSSQDPCALFLISRSWCSSLVTYSPHWRENDPQHSWGIPWKVKSPISLRNCLLPEMQLT